MKKVTFEFVGQDAEEMAQKFYTWFVDGGLEDQVVDTLSDMGAFQTVQSGLELVL